VNVLFGEGVLEVFQEFPRPVQVKAARIIDLIAVFSEIYPVRRIGLMRGYRYFNALGYYFYYSISSQEIRVTAVHPGRMEQA